MGCATNKVDNSNSQSNSEYFNKVCITGTGKGRIEFLANKYPFTYESTLDRANKQFQLAFDFPIVGERKMILDLDPRKTAQKLNHSQIVRLLQSQIGEREDKENIIQAVEEFFVLTSEFIQFRAVNKFPEIYETEFKNDHYILKRIHGDHLFVVDSFILNKDFFERVIVKVFPNKSSESSPILTLFLVPETCEK